jgi:hypothetical protein
VDSDSSIVKNIIMTTPKDPKTTFGHKCEEDIDQLLRRIDHIIDMDQSQKSGNIIPTSISFWQYLQHMESQETDQVGARQS